MKIQRDATYLMAKKHVKKYHNLPVYNECELINLYIDGYNKGRIDGTCETQKRCAEDNLENLKKLQ